MDKQISSASIIIVNIHIQELEQNYSATWLGYGEAAPPSVIWVRGWGNQSFRGFKFVITFARIKAPFRNVWY